MRHDLWPFAFDREQKFEVGRKPRLKTVMSHPPSPYGERKHFFDLQMLVGEF